MILGVNSWKKEIIRIEVDNFTLLSVPFTWLLPEAQKIINDSKKKIIAGGTAVQLMPDYLQGAITDSNLYLDWLPIYNPLATRTTIGCPNRCKFCGVKRIHPEFVEIKNFIPRPLLCDDNLLASSKKHFNNVIEKLKHLPFVDFNQGLDASLFSNYHADGITKLKNPFVRFAFDNITEETSVASAIERARKKGLKKIGCYVLIGFNDSPEDALYRLNLLRDMKLRPYPMRYQPLDTLRRNSYVDKSWTETELKKMVRYWSRQIWLEHVPYEDFENTKSDKRESNQKRLF